MKENIIDVWMERGFVDQMTSPDLREHASRPLKAYIGFDPTADSLHLGNLMAIMALAWLQKFGHTPCVLIGGATGRVGDPSGKSTERPLLSDEILARNVSSLTKFFHKILYSPTGSMPVILNNSDWLGKMSLVDFLRDAGKHFRVGSMLAKESVRSRLQSEEGLSFTEFSYQILQGYDFYYLNQHHGVTLEMGGSDQWGNITSGTEYNRKLKGDILYGLTFPLLTRSDGKKFGKTEEGAVWLSAEKLSPYQFYQYLIRVPDADVIWLLRMLTFLDLPEIQAIEESMQRADYEANSAQKKLALEVTRFVHGSEGLEAALRVTEGIAPGAECQLSSVSFKELAADMPHALLPRHGVVGQRFVDVAWAAGLISSKSEGVRLMKNGGAYLNNERVLDPSYLIEAHHLVDGIYLLLGSGKKKRILVEVQI